MFRILRLAARAAMFTITSGLALAFVVARLALPGASLTTILAVTLYLAITAPITIRAAILAARLLDAAFPDGLAA